MDEFGQYISEITPIPGKSLRQKGMCMHVECMCLCIIIIVEQATSLRQQASSLIIVRVCMWLLLATSGVKCFIHNYLQVRSMPHA